MLGDGVRFDLDHLAFEQTLAGAITDPSLETLNQALVLLHRAGANRHVVVFGEDPGIEIGGHISAHVHLGEIFVVGHLLSRQLPAEEMTYYEDLAEMYVGTDVSPDFYAWVFPKYDHVAVGTGANRHVVVFGEDPGIEIGGHISAHVHLGEIFVVGHLLSRQLPAEEMTYYEDLAEMYVGTDVSPDFYAWVFPKYDHVAVGTGTMQQNQSLIKGLQRGIRDRASKRLFKGEVIKVEAHPIPEHPRPRRVVGRMALVGDAAGYVTKSSGEGIYFAAKSGRMCAEAIVEISNNGQTIPTEKQIKSTYLKRWDRKYGATYAVLDILQRIFYRNDAAREAFVEMCDDMDVQKLTFDSYLYKRVVMMNPWQQIKLTLRTLGSLLRGEALAPAQYGPVPSAVGRSDGDILAEEAAQAIRAQAKNKDTDKETAKVN